MYIFSFVCLFHINIFRLTDLVQFIYKVIAALLFSRVVMCLFVRLLDCYLTFQFLLMWTQQALLMRRWSITQCTWVNYLIVVSNNLLLVITTQLFSPMKVCWLSSFCCVNLCLSRIKWIPYCRIYCNRKRKL